MNTPEYTPWVEHVYASLRWAEGSIRKLHELLESETLDDEVRSRAARAIGWIDSARKEAFFAFEKMGNYGSNQRQSKLDVSSIGEETKIKMLRLNATYLEASVESVEGNASYDSLRSTMLYLVETMRREADEIERERKRSLEGPPGA